MNEQEFHAIVHQHRDERASSLEFSPSIEKLIDVEHCKQITNLVHGTGLRWEVQKAVPNQGQRAHWDSGEE